VETHVRVVAISHVYLLDNLPRLATLIHRARAGVAQLIVALSGDFLAPSVLSSLDNGLGMVACLNALGVTHVTFGNHEDDVPHVALIERMRELSARWLASNVQIPGQALLDHDVIEVNGVRIVVPAEVAAALARAEHDGSSLVADIVVGALDSNRDGVVSKDEAGS
jgi:2',3'-cyclic-nucleotide 2'-phosphodiesterase (5'-nucleotidase family)